MDLIAAYLKALKQILNRKKEYIADCQVRIKNADKVSEIRKKREDAEQMLQEQISKIQDLVHENAKKVQDQDKYRQKYDRLYKKIEKQKDLIATLKAEELKMIAERETLRRFTKAIENSITTKFSSDTWNDTIRRAIVEPDKTIILEFKNDETIKVEI